MYGNEVLKRQGLMPSFESENAQMPYYPPGANGNGPPVSVNQVPKETIGDHLREMQGLLNEQSKMLYKLTEELQPVLDPILDRNVQLGEGIGRTVDSSSYIDLVSDMRSKVLYNMNLIMDLLNRHRV